jgi:adhesin transport system membrane fusion protein
MTFYFGETGRFSGEAHQSTFRLQSLAVWLIAACFASFGVWAYLAKLDEVTSAQGQVVPILQEQTIESLEGGILSNLHVRTDQIVEAGQILATLDQTGTAAAVDETSGRLRALLAKVARLQAEVTDGALEFSPALSNYPDLIKSETALFEARKNSRTNYLALIEQSRNLIEDELAKVKRLNLSGASSSIEASRLEQQIIDLNMKREDIRHEHYVLAREDLTETLSEIDALSAEQRRLQDRLDRMTIRSPLRGIVKNIEVATKGGVLPPNGALMTIIPLDDLLLVEARIEPRDVAFIRPGLRAVVTISAYDPAIYGTLEGSVRSISADTIRDELNPEIMYYRVYVESENFELKDGKGGSFPISPGMVTTVDIHTGSRTVMQYFMKPFNKAGEALRER